MKVITGKFSEKEILRLKEKGWEFFQTGPNEFDWLKFDNDGNLIGRRGDQTWSRDVKEICEVEI